MKKYIFLSVSLLTTLLAVTMILFPGVGLAAVGGGVLLGATIAGTPTFDNTEQAAPLHQKRSISQIVTEIRPNQVPLDQMLRSIRKAEQVDNVKVEYETVTYRGVSDTLTAAYVAASSQQAVLNVTNVHIWGVDDAVHIPTILGGDSKALVCKVLIVDSANDQLTVTAVNGGGASGQEVPAIADATEIYRMSAGKTELASTTDIITELPVFDYNYCETKMAYLERSKLSSKIKSYSGYGHRNKTKQQIYDYRSRCDASTMYGAMGRVIKPNVSSDNVVYQEGGITRQITQSEDFGTGSGAVDPSVKDVAEMLEMAFANNAGSEKRLLLVGKELATGLSLITLSREIGAMEKKVVHGVSVDVLHSRFGEVYIKHSLTMDQNADSKNGYVFDLDHIYRHELEKLTMDKLDPDKSGNRRVQDSLRILETSCSTLRYPATHLKWSPAS